MLLYKFVGDRPPGPEQPTPAPPEPEEPTPKPPQPEIPPAGPEEPHLPSPDPEPLPSPVPGPTDPAVPRPILAGKSAAVRRRIPGHGALSQAEQVMDSKFRLV
jgi:hypothetical protein